MIIEVLSVKIGGYWHVQSNISLQRLILSLSICTVYLMHNIYPGVYMCVFVNTCTIENISFLAIAPVREANALCGRSQGCTCRERFNGGGTRLLRLSQPPLLSFPSLQIPSLFIISSQCRVILLSVSQG